MVAAVAPIEKDGELPSYRDALDRTSGQSNSAVFRSKHSYSLNTAKGKAWLCLEVPSRAVSTKVLPVFRDGDEISGQVKVDLEKPESWKGVLVGIVADYTAVGQEPRPFIDLSMTLWTSSSSSPKLVGTHTWPFTLSLPKEVQLAITPKEPTKSYPLPPTFSERASPAYIDYKLIVTVKRGRFKVNQTLGTSFAFVPRWVAPPPSPLRMAGYRDGSPLIGPQGDPEGWKLVSPVEITGTLFDTKNVEVEMILALSTPLSYAVGSPIPLLLTLKSTDSQVLDLLGQPSAITVYLTRMAAIGSTATDDEAQRRSNNTFLEHYGRAYWWLSEEGAPQDGVRVLMGEIDVPKSMKPSFMFPWLSLRYQISIFSPSVAGFVPSMPKDEVLFSEKVSIVTDNAPGIFPRSHAPPSYVKPSEGNYNNSMGYLENGNQRFYHHHQR